MITSSHPPALRSHCLLLFPISLYPSQHTFGISDLRLYTITHSFIKHSLRGVPEMPNMGYTDEFNTHSVLKELTVQFSFAYITTWEKGPEHIANTEKIKILGLEGALESSWLFCG